MEFLEPLFGYRPSGLELVGVVFGLVYIFLSIRQNVWCWPVSLISVGAYVILAYQIRLYSDVILNAYYVGAALYGWWYWLHGGRRGTEAPVRRTRPPEALVLLLLGVLGTALAGYLFATYTDADLPYWDAFTTAFSFVATWMLAQKALENWLLWIVVDAVLAGVYAYKALYFTSGLFAVYTVLAIVGYRAWKRSMGP